ncbi:hypothetical protein PV08_01397 [Exophiala spinifera]|uniref:Asp/Glu/hydantoin racemase n=1 Tax=Exophiala spinifera TaxID=91928 RepID=A0A0D2CB87_9EURO|nr:uncharacterized protein PV08_01397 [Exophiala spinifera]KIW20819.1 hypothetical protein PV08_01397 [Exophiala spinifera]
MSIKRLLVINPNASPAITELVKSGTDSHLGPNIIPTYWTCPEGPAVLTSQADIDKSTKLCLRELKPMIEDYDAFLLACYADHPFSAALKVEVGSKPVVGVFEASVNAALEILQPPKRFVIMTTGKAYEKQLSDGVKRLLGESKVQSYFAGAVSTGISPPDTMPEISETARQKVREGVKRLMSNDEIEAICMGGVILYGMEDFVMQSCQAELGADTARKIVIIDQLEAGVAMLKHELKIDI